VLLLTALLSVLFPCQDPSGTFTGRISKFKNSQHRSDQRHTRALGRNVKLRNFSTSILCYAVFLASPPLPLSLAHHINPSETSPGTRKTLRGSVHEHTHIKESASNADGIAPIAPDASAGNTSASPSTLQWNIESGFVTVNGVRFGGWLHTSPQVRIPETAFHV
jgi:hypothetical protein